MRTRLLTSNCCMNENETIVLNYERRNTPCPIEAASRTSIQHHFLMASCVQFVLHCVYWISYGGYYMVYQILAYLIRTRPRKQLFQFNRKSIFLMAAGDICLGSLSAYNGKLMLDAKDSNIVPFVLWGIILLMVIDQWTCLYLLWKFDANHPASIPGRCECRVVEVEKGTSCSICLEDFDSTAVAIEICSHIFHESCLQKWIDIKPSCPICRTDVEDRGSLIVDDQVYV